MFSSYVKNKDSQDSIIFGDGNQGKVKGLGKIAISNEHSIWGTFHLNVKQKKDKLANIAIEGGYPAT